MTPSPENSSTKLSTWTLIQLDKFDEAIASADAEFAASKSLVTLRNKVVALLMLNKQSQAVELLNYIIETDGGRIEKDFQLLGIILMHSAVEGEPFIQFSKGLEAEYSDAAGGIVTWIMWLLCANVARLKHESERAKREIDAIIQKRGKTWPAILGFVALGHLSLDDLQSSLSENSIVRKKQCAQAYAACAAGVSDGKERSKYLKDVLDCAPEAYILTEYHLARLLSF